MTQHTPGPWEVADTSIVTEQHCIAVIEDDGGYEAPAEQRIANARLIAASPDLLAVCQMFIDECDSNPVHPDDMDPDWKAIEKLCREAVQKATGLAPAAT